MNNLFDGMNVNNNPPKKGLMFCDGGSRGNPGPAAGAFVIYDESDNIAVKEGEYFGEVTNNVAEYQALLAGLQAGLENKFTDLEVRLDSKLLVEQMSGNWKVKNPAMKVLVQRAKEITDQFEAVKFMHVPREKNKEADRLVNEILDEHS